MASLGLPNLEFVEGDLDALELSERFHCRAEELPTRIARASSGEATVSAIDLKGLNRDAPDGKGSFTGSLTIKSRQARSASTPLSTVRPSR